MKQNSSPDLHGYFNPSRLKVCLLKQNQCQGIDTSILEPHSTSSLSKTYNSNRTIEYMQGELNTRNNTLSEQNAKLKVQIALVEHDNRCLLEKVDKYDEQITKVHNKVKDLLVQQNKQFFQINQQLSQEILSSKFGQSLVRPLRDSNEGFRSQVMPRNMKDKQKERIAVRTKEN